MAESVKKKAKAKKKTKLNKVVLEKKTAKPEPKAKTEPAKVKSTTNVSSKTEPYKKIGKVIELRGHVINVDWSDIMQYNYIQNISAGNKHYGVIVKSKMPFFQWYERSLKRNVGEFYKADDKQRRKLLKEAINKKANLLFRIREEDMIALAVLSEKTIMWTSDDLKNITESEYKGKAKIDCEPSDGIDGGSLTITLSGSKPMLPKIIAKMGRLNGQQGAKISPGITFSDDGFSVIADDFSTKNLHIATPKMFVETIKDIELYLPKILACVPECKNIKLAAERQKYLLNQYLEQNRIGKKTMNAILTSLNGKAPKNSDTVKLPATTMFDFLSAFGKLAEQETSPTVKESLQKIAGELLVKYDSLI